MPMSAKTAEEVFTCVGVGLDNIEWARGGYWRFRSVGLTMPYQSSAVDRIPSRAAENYA